MTATVLRPPVVTAPERVGRSHADSSSRRRARRSPGLPPDRGALGGYSDLSGRPREIVSRPGLDGSVLIIDRDAATLADRRLVAHLAADEPSGNAVLVCRIYLQDAAQGRGRCRLLTAEDFSVMPLGFDGETDLPAQAAWPGATGTTESTSTVAGDGLMRDRLGREYQLRPLFTDMTIPELRWRRHTPAPADGSALTMSLRDVVGALESYEPVRSVTIRALVAHRGDGQLSTTVLRAELARVQESPIVLNRGLREAALHAIKRHGVSMSEVAIRCGRVKHDRAGNESGETSWLARRLGLLSEGGRKTPTPWIHSDVLALIARRGLGISPREVELT